MININLLNNLSNLYLNTKKKFKNIYKKSNFYDKKISRIKNKTRVRLLIKSNKMTKISQIEVRDWLKNILVPNNVYFSVDIDPYNFYQFRGTIN